MLINSNFGFHVIDREIGNMLWQCFSKIPDQWIRLHLFYLFP